MTKRSINTSIEEVLVSNSEFEYAHLIKFERPFPIETDANGVKQMSTFRTNANRYAYFTDASRDISFNDASTDHEDQSNGSQIYRANRVKSIGSYSETTSPRATNMALTLSGDHLGTSLSITGDFGSAAFTVATTFHDDADATDLVDFGFREGDKVRTQFFRGVVIQIKGQGLSKTFTIRKMSGTVGVERIFPLNLPALEKIEVNKKGKVRRSRIYYFKGLTGKKARIKEARLDS